ncbi:nitrogenase component 1 [Inediibacterium massiliense]|uniref:nitrogenase component 1 n=1 Tax=Inediibacterium massiliense TaxID=1658111 RepID=UPI0006B5A8F8|nr:nitrogenase component 1 [Inediibacterium massiliense]
MKNYSQNIMGDSLTGALLALEGIKDGLVILNGPTGCKFYHSAISDGQYPRQLSFDPLNFPEEFYFGQPRIPCTYLDGYDYVYGASDKLKKILKTIKEDEYSFLAIVNSPGAALIGDDLNRFIKNEVKGIHCISIESTGFSGFFSDGFQKAMIKVLEDILNETKETIPNSVNLIGIPIYDLYYEGNIKEIKRILNLCGIKVISTLCAGDSIKTLKNASKAEYNIVLSAEYGLDIAKWMDKHYHIPYLLLEKGAPIGFDATKEMIEQLSNVLKIHMDLFIEELEKARARSYLYISRFHSLTGLPKGATFSIKAEASRAYALTKWLYTYLGMLPVSIEIVKSSNTLFEEKLLQFLKDLSYEEVLSTLISERVGQILFADGNTIAQLRWNEKKFTGIEISLPSLGYLHIIPKSIFGISGSLMIIEQILNGLRFLS